LVLRDEGRALVVVAVFVLFAQTTTGVIVIGGFAVIKTNLFTQQAAAGVAKAVLFAQLVFNFANLQMYVVVAITQATVDSICQRNTPFNYLFRCFELQCLSWSVV
jgi:hypothetical protein